VAVGTLPTSVAAGSSQTAVAVDLPQTVVAVGSPQTIVVVGSPQTAVALAHLKLRHNRILSTAYSSVFTDHTVIRPYGLIY